MTAFARHLDIGKITVGASAEMPISKLTERHAHESPEGENGAKLIRTTWSIESYAIAASEAAVGQLKETLKTNLTKRGEAVVLIERADAGTPVPATRTLAAGGSVGGPLPGYPRCQVETMPDDSSGPFVTFRLTVESVAPAAGLSDPVWHDHETTTSTDQSEAETTRRTGTVRVANGSSAESWVRTNVIDPARAAADAAGRRFSDRVTVGLDTAQCSYEYTDQEPGSNGYGGGGIDDASVTVREQRVRDGGSVERVTGYAVGTSASTFAENQRPSQDNFRVIVKDQVSSPSVPQGRVDFDFEVRIGKTVPSLFNDAVVFEYRHSIREQGGGAPILSADRFNALPRLFRGRNTPYAYVETATVVYMPQTAINIFAQTGMSASLDTDNIHGAPDRDVTRDADGFYTATIAIRYRFDSEQTMPTPRTIAGALT